MPEQPHQQLAQQFLGCTYEELTPVQRSVIDLIATEAPGPHCPLPQFAAPSKPCLNFA